MIEQERGDAEFIQTDVTDSDDVEAVVSETLDTYGELNFAHNNAGIEGDAGPLADVSEEDWDQVLGVNLKGVWQCMKHEIPEMIDNGGGNIVNTASISGLTGTGPGPYVASKHGVIGLTRKAAVDYADDNVRVNAVCPGVVNTPMVQQSGDPELIDEATASQPIDRLGEPEEIANAAVWLCSDDASFVMGHPLPVDGGPMVQ
jgi:NAD(P)-dependent dehydrogenase (short-subunit alcohol dehydrogenase family)